MRPLRVALVHRDSDRCMDKRMVGIWSSPVPEFQWHHFPTKKAFVIDRSHWRGFDIIFYEDGKLHGHFVASGPPVVYYVVDSTLSDDHLKIRRDQAQYVDLVLVDHDRLNRLKVGPPVSRLSHCANTELFQDYGLEKDIDVSFHCRTKGSAERLRVEERLHDFCHERGYAYACGTRFDRDYAHSFNRSKITVNVTRTPINRPHRVFDALACRTCMITTPLPRVSGETRRAGRDYLQYNDIPELFTLIDKTLADGSWKGIADAGFELVQEHHSWAVRAKQLRQILNEKLGL